MIWSSNVNSSKSDICGFIPKRDLIRDPSPSIPLDSTFSSLRMLLKIIRCLLETQAQTLLLAIGWRLNTSKRNSSGRISMEGWFLYSKFWETVVAQILSLEGQFIFHLRTYNKSRYDCLEHGYEARKKTPFYKNQRLNTSDKDHNRNLYTWYTHLITINN